MQESVTLEHIVGNRVTLLAELNRRQAVVRDYVRGVPRQYATGLYLFGRAGTAKTHTVRGVLEQEIGEPYCYQRGPLTASIEQHLVAVRHAADRPGRDDRKQEEHAILREILKEHPTREERVRAWSSRTGKSERAFYRRLAEMQ